LDRDEPNAGEAILRSGCPLAARHALRLGMA
jgi:hypothetical protein